MPTPYINAGSKKLTLDGYYRSDAPDQRQHRQRLTYDYGYSDRLLLRSRLVRAQDAKGKYDANELELAAITAFSDAGRYWLDSGLYGGLHFREDGGSMWTARLLLAKQMNQWQFRSNLILRNDFGDDAGAMRPEARWRLSYAWPESGIHTGVEYFGRYGSVNHLRWQDASHQLGPVIIWNSPNRQLYTEAGAVFGLTDETEAVLAKWRIGVRF